jgi:rubrerythrin
MLRTPGVFMEATATGPNRTGAAVNPEGIASMLEAVNDLSPPIQINMQRSDIERQRYISEAESVGSISPPQSALKSTVAKVRGVTGTATMSVLLDKIGERIAFERTGTRLYGAVITKYVALANEEEIPLSPSADGEPVLETLLRIRNEELQHFQMLSQCMKDLGGDATAQTPCADVTAASTIGLLQVVTDPRTTLAQSLNAVLTAELTDSAGWELLSELAELAGQKQLVAPFSEALAAEETHVEIVRGWLRTLITEAPGTPAV